MPFAALVPVRLRNLLAGAKNIGTTHITNGAYRLHPVEWNVGESAGLLAAFSLRHGVAPAGVCDDARLTRRLQVELVDQGVPLFWYTDVPDRDPAFAAAQLLTTWGIWPAEPEHLLFRPQDSMALEAAQSLIARARDRFPDALPSLPPARLMSRSEWARLLLQTVSA
jgi:hypothetical protein